MSVHTHPSWVMRTQNKEHFTVTITISRTKVVWSIKYACAYLTFTGNAHNGFEDGMAWPQQVAQKNSSRWHKKFELEVAASSSVTESKNMPVHTYPSWVITSDLDTTA